MSNDFRFFLQTVEIIWRSS